MGCSIDVLCTGFPAGTGVAGLGYATMALVASGDQSILVDTGGPGVRSFLLKALQSRGLTPADVKQVLLTHLHWDHCCNVDLFPHAEFILSRVEWNYSMSVDPYEAPFVYGGYLPLLRAFKKRFIESDGEEILEGATSLILGGHSPGGLALVLDVNGERCCIAGDAIKNLGELGRMEPNGPSDAAFEALQKVRSRCSRVLPGHDGWLRWENGRASRDGDSVLQILFRGGALYNGRDRMEISLK